MLAVPNMFQDALKRDQHEFVLDWVLLEELLELESLMFPCSGLLLF